MLRLSRFLLEERGQSLTEYALLLSVLVLSVVFAMASVGSKVSTLFNNASESINQ